MHAWYLEGVFDTDGALKKQRLSLFPQVLGRDSRLDCTIFGASISRRHAVLDEIGDSLQINDLDSRNGTYVNRKRINAPTEIHHGDVIHLGDTELRLIDGNHRAENDAQETDKDSDETTFISLKTLSQNFPSGITDLEQLLAKNQLTTVYQPIIRATDLACCGFEILGRGANPNLPKSPLDLFNLAESFSLEVKLSELMRDLGVETAVKHGLRGELLVNTHPKEISQLDRLLGSLQQLRKRHSSTRLMLEIHEHAVTNDIDLLKSLKTELGKMQIRLAFDDFGVGQSRLLEMVEAKPDLIKFDKVLIENIDSADESRLNLVTHLKDLAAELSINTLAECVGTEAEFEKCKEMGFKFYQGFYLARPQEAIYFARRG